MFGSILSTRHDMLKEIVSGNSSNGMIKGTGKNLNRLTTNFTDNKSNDESTIGWNWRKTVTHDRIAPIQIDMRMD